MRAKQQDSDASQYWATQRKIERLQQARVEDIHYIGATGEPGFQNGWTNLTSARPVGYYVHQKHCHLVGLASGGSVAELPAFTLPEAAWPHIATTNILFSVISDGAFGAVAVNSNGEVWLYIGNNAYFDLEQVRFRIA